ncbi:DNA topology modulation protein FlaR [Radiobacillus sp. PE A8.2]|uniref:DNA topology modulation protein FlaR n=1 Tax=Radiobacillus sp. PE A8.2 TaxID=3380349 RepID=UPI00388FD9D2
MVANKIHIIGSVASGKTTLAKNLSSRYNVPYYELDNVVWKRNKTGDIRRTEKERETILRTIINSDTWIIEGVHNGDWVKSSFEHAQMIIFLDTRYTIRIYRIIKRFVLQILRLERSNYRPTFRIFIKMFKWNNYFEIVSKPAVIKQMNLHNDKFVVIRNEGELRRLLDKR